MTEAISLLEVNFLNLREELKNQEINLINLEKKGDEISQFLTLQNFPSL